MKGRVKWFLADKGYGFIEPEDGQGEVFVHRKDLPGQQSLMVRSIVEFEVVPAKEPGGRRRAKKLRVLSEPADDGSSPR